MKKLLRLSFILLVAAGMLFMSCPEFFNVAVTGVTLSSSTLGLLIGETATLTATVTPADATDPSVTWASNAASVATVANGVVTAVGIGSATITVTTTDGTFIGTCAVTVTGIAVTGVTLTPDTLNMVDNDTANLTATIAPANATLQTVSWSTNNAAVATVAAGVVTATGPGVATITVTTTDGTFTDTCAVTVTPLAVTGVSLTPATADIQVARTANLTAAISPANATDLSVSWSSNNESVATVANGVVTAVALGTATIMVTTTDGGITDTCDVTVIPVAVTGVTLSTGRLNLLVGATDTLVATVAPGDAADPSISWSTSNAGIATVANGSITAVALGTATITVTTTDGLFTDTCIVAVTALTLDFESDIAGVTTYSGMGWTGTPANVGAVVAIASITAGGGLPANDSSNVLKVQPSDWNEIPVFTITIPGGNNLGFYSTISVDVYFTRNSLGVTNAENYYKDFMLIAGTTLTGGAQSTNAMHYFTAPQWNEIDMWKTFTFNISPASVLNGTIQIGIGISRPGIVAGDEYYLDNIVLQ